MSLPKSMAMSLFSWVYALTFWVLVRCLTESAKERVC